MDLVGAVKVCFVKYANFSDRASRSEFWLFMLFVTILGIVLAIIDVAIGVPLGESSLGGTIVGLVTFIPSLSVAARRLHDLNRSGWWILLYLTIIGILFPLLYWYCKKGDDGENDFGPNPIG